MKHLTLLIVLLFSATVQAEPLTQEHNLAIGESVTLPTTRFESIRIQKKGLLTVRDSENTVTLVGKKLGATKVSMSGKDYFINILPIGKYRTFKALKAWIKNKRGPAIEIKQRQIILKGQLLRLSDFVDLNKFMSSEADFHLQLKMSKKLEQQVSEHIKSLLDHNNLSTGVIGFKPTLKLLIQKNQKELLSQYRKILNPYGIQTTVDTSTLTLKPMIKIQIYIAHVQKSFIRQWGMQWPSTFSAQVIPDAKVALETLSLSLHALESQGTGQLLASPTLITESEKLAEFHSGGEFPVTTTTQFNNSVQWKRYGLFLKATPKTNPKGHMHIDIDLKISTLDHNNGANGVPALQRSEVKTQVNMKSPTPVLLSGFLRQQTNDGKEGLPWLSQIPVFNPLFSTNQTINSESELIFILVPSFYE